MSGFIGRRWTLCAMFSVLALIATGCTSRSGRSGPVSPAATGSSTSSAAPSKSGAAIAKYGQPAVDAAVKEMLRFSFGSGWSSHLISIHVDQVTRNDFAPVLSYLTAEAASRFNTVLAKVLKHDKIAIRTLEGAIFFGIKGANGSRPIRSGKVVTDRRYTQVAVGLDRAHGADRMSVTFTAKANINLQDQAGKNYVLPTERKVRYLLVPNTGADQKSKPFLIAGWLNKMTAGKIQPAK